MIRERIRSAVIWSGLDIFAQQGVGLVISIVLARLLVPEEFGTVALLSFFTGVAGVFVHVGLGQALIQCQNVTHQDESTVFWLNIVSAIVMMLLLMAISPWIADFFGLSVLEPLANILALNIFLGAMGSIHHTLMTKRLDFKTPMKIGFSSTLVSGMVGIYMAMTGYGLWALVAQIIIGTLVSTILLWFLSPWRPLWQVSKQSFYKLFGFGGWLFISSFLDTVYQRGYALMIGKFYGTYQLGVFNRADSIQQMPVSVLTSVLQRVSFPILSAVNHDTERLKRGVRLSIRSMTLITSPVMMGLVAVSEPFVLMLFGEQWLPAVPILKVLCLAGLLWPMHVVNLSALQAQGHSKLFFRLEVLKKTTGLSLLVVGSLFGIIGIAWSRVFQSVIALYINSFYTKKFLAYGMLSQVKDVLPAILMSITMCIILRILSPLIETNNFVLLAISVFVGSVLYLIMNIIFGVSAFRELLSWVRGAHE